MSFVFINKTLQLNNLKTRTALSVKSSVFVTCLEAIVYLWLYNLQDCNFKFCPWYFFSMLGKFAPTKLPQSLIFSLKASYLQQCLLHLTPTYFLESCLDNPISCGRLTYYLQLKFLASNTFFQSFGHYSLEVDIKGVRFILKKTVKDCC